MLKPDELSVMRALKKLLATDFPNCVTVTTVDNSKIIEDKLATKCKKIRHWWKDMEEEMVPDLKPVYPFALLGQEGWEALDPFVPIEVPIYSEGELETMIDYYLDKRYINWFLP